MFIQVGFIRLGIRTEETNLHDVVHKWVSEHPVQLDKVVLQDVLEAALWTVLGEDATRRDARADEPHEVIVMQVLHL